MNTPTANRKQKQLRTGLAAFAALLALQSIWIILPGLIGPSVLVFPREPRSPPIISSERDRAIWAAELARVRGDLWAEAAFAQSPESARESLKTAPSTERVQAARAAAENAAKLSPHDARIWLLLAYQDCLLHREPSSTLKMSYYTGPSEIALMPLRLLVATCSEALNDSELRALVEGEIRFAIRKQALRLAIVAAYQNASPNAKRFVETIVGDLDSGLIREQPK